MLVVLPVGSRASAGCRAPRWHVGGGTVEHGRRMREKRRREEHSHILRFSPLLFAGCTVPTAAVPAGGAYTVPCLSSINPRPRTVGMGVVVAYDGTSNKIHRLFRAKKIPTAPLTMLWRNHQMGLDGQVAWPLVRRGSSNETSRWAPPTFLPATPIHRRRRRAVGAGRRFARQRRRRAARPAQTARPGSPPAAGSARSRRRGPRGAAVIVASCARHRRSGAASAARAAARSLARRRRATCLVRVRVRVRLGLGLGLGGQG